MSRARADRSLRALGRSRARPLVALVLLAVLASSCAYYNTFYLARRHYDRASQGQPYSLDKADATAQQNYQKSIDYAKKVISIYPKSKWVDDAHLMWGRALVGREDPLLAVDVLQAFPTRFPDSPLRNEAMFYLGVAYRQARKYADSERMLDTFLVAEPRHELAPYAHLERARALMALDRSAEAAVAAGHVIERFPESRLQNLALRARADALFATRDYPHARIDFQALGLRANTDDERFDYLLREVDALEGARKYEEALTLLRDALAHEVRPAIADTSGAITPVSSNPAGARYGRLQTRIGSVYLAAERQPEALEAYRDVLRLYPRTLLAAEAQYRIGYAHEVGADDFESARAEYALVRNHMSSSAFTEQAALRLENLERIARYRSAGGDSLDKKVEAGFLLAEVYLFQLDKPDRALTEYRRIALEYPNTPHAAKAMNAEAWVLRHKFDQPAAADSVLWVVVREHPRTEGQLSARDYLERAGHQVPDSLIKLPEVTVTLAAADTGAVLSQPPDLVAPLGPRGGITIEPDSLARTRGQRPPGVIMPGAPADSLLFRPGFTPIDTVRRILAPPAPRDSGRIER
ncbi:MAG TPA: tetratricopeptide repeat protein [Candidatus Limnocylindria bacterium]|nr:tetratricopeptide repeat protein [Candidatus Limnocylindria bacterium]